MAALRDDATAFSAAIGDDLAAHVPACPEWTARDLVIHLGHVYQWWEAVVARRPADEAAVEQLHTELAAIREVEIARLATAERPELVNWFDAYAQQLQRTLSAAAPEDHNWTWFPPDQTAGFVQRRMAQETAVHRWDMQDTFGTAKEIAPDVAADGIDEWLEIHFPMSKEEGEDWGTNGSMHIHTTDAAGEWLMTLEPSGPSFSRDHAKADVAVRGTASDLLLVLWGRKPPETVEILGERSVLDRYLTIIDLD